MGGFHKKGQGQGQCKDVVGWEVLTEGQGQGQGQGRGGVGGLHRKTGDGPDMLAAWRDVQCW